MSSRAHQRGALDEANQHAHVLLEAARGKSSRWAPYLETLPQAYDIPLLWDQAEAEALLQGTPLLQTVRAAAAYVRQHPGQVSPQLSEQLAALSMGDIPDFLTRLKARRTELFRQTTLGMREATAVTLFELCSKCGPELMIAAPRCYRCGYRHGAALFDLGAELRRHLKRVPLPNLAPGGGHLMLDV